MTAKTTLEIEGKQVAVSNLDKVFYPATGFTKGGVIDYYLRIPRSPPSSQPPSYQPETVSGRREWDFLLRKAVPPAPPRMDENGEGRKDGRRTRGLLRS